MRKVVTRGLLACGLALFTGGVRGTPPATAAISEVVPSGKELEDYCFSLPNVGCAQTRFAAPLATRGMSLSRSKGEQRLLDMTF